MAKVRIGAVGLGRLGRRHAENIAFRIPNAELKAVCSIVKEEVDAVVRDWKIDYGYYSFEDMLKNQDLDAVCISSSSTEHCVQSIKALERGWHVFCEKPLGVGLEETRLTQRAVDQHPNQIFQLGFMRRYDASYAYAKQKIDEGLIGDPILIRCYGLDPVSAIDGTIAFAEKSGGLFSDLVIHDFDLARWFLGSEAKSVYSLGGCFAYKEFAKYGDVDNGVAVIQFQNNTMGLFYGGRACNHGYHVETEIVGTKGSLRVGTVPYKNLVTISTKHGVANECVGSFLERFDEAYRNEMQEFINAIIDKKQPAVKVNDGVRATEIAHAATKALQTKQVIFFD